MRIQEARHGRALLRYGQPHVPAARTHDHGGTAIHRSGGTEQRERRSIDVINVSGVFAFGRRVGEASRNTFGEERDHFGSGSWLGWLGGTNGGANGGDTTRRRDNGWRVDRERVRRGFRAVRAG